MIAFRLDGPGRVPPGASPQWQRMIERLYAISTSGVVLGLERVARVLELLGHPERRFPAIHVVGSNGKGSTAAFAAHILAAGGRRVGLYTSPHLERINERVQVVTASGSEALPDAELLAAFSAVESVAPEFGDLSFFEVLTAAGLHAFAERGIDVAVVEAGLGARLDATRLVNAEVAVLTELTLEHTAILGSSLEAIAAEKAAVIRPGRPLVTAGAPPGAWALIEREAIAQAAPVWRIGGEIFVSRRIDGSYDFDLGDRRLEAVHLALLGGHQGRNAVLAARAATLFDPALDAAAIRRGLGSTSWPGRLELVPGSDPPLVLDGAHNAQGVEALVAALSAEPALAGPTHAVFGVLGDKDAKGMLERLAGAVSSLVLTRADTPRARPPEELLPMIAPALRGHVFTAASLPEALAIAEPRAKLDGGRVLVCGSLYLVGEASLLRKKG